MKLTAKQKKFADNYIELGNATQAAIKAGYRERSARSVGNENLTKPDIKAYIDERMAVIDSKRTMSAKEAVELLTSIARGEVKETVVVAAIDGVHEVQKEADLKTRISATREILKRYPGSDELAKQQLRKLTAEADIAENNAKVAQNDSGTFVIEMDEFKVEDDN
ncbi:terminase small subunit [Convivina intestini]|uniref:Phage terminase small subunit n=1 Tax=Convivina intestini TaxID=1505726 RepID=A0A2U1D4F7_9LACO|nr:terminase small subunit [Convivina intestini]PVY82555.1 phage terminase small subunit [Convivina intestini]SDC25428.1 phage terminase small subunit [Leuconostocaceae bacterium R-53105]